MREQMTYQSIEYGLRKTTWERRGETIDRLTHGQVKERKRKRRKTGCSAGASCHDPGREMLWLKSPLADTNASKCYNCDSISHDCCSYLWDNHDYCIDCFKEEVMSKCSTIETFCALLKKNKQSPRGRKAITLGAQDIQSSVDEYLCTEAKLDMNLEQYLEWKRNEEKSLKETASDPDKGTWLERTRIYNIRKTKYNKCIAAAKEDWILSKDGVVNGLSYNPRTCEFEASVQYLDENKMQKEAEMMVEPEWVIDEYGGAPFANKLIDAAENDNFLMIPCDENGHVTYCQYEGQVIVTNES